MGVIYQKKKKESDWYHIMSTLDARRHVRNIFKALNENYFESKIFYIQSKCYLNVKAK